MNFFEHQDNARRKTGLLILLLLGAVFCLISLSVLGIGLALGLAQQSANSGLGQEQASVFEGLISFAFSDIALLIAAGVTGLVLIGSLYKYIELRKGGRYIAQSLGGRLLQPDSRDYDERKVLNIVEEMAIASGNPVPSVYLIEDMGINAFAAGHDHHNAVIGVTSGCITLLNRHELQGVIAHEFSHIHNGDMRLNMRLIAILNGILMIGLIGEFIVHGFGYRVRSRDRDNNKLVVVGFALIVFGYIGTFFGNIIKAAVSRQREFLADASAVQFTRNPEGIAGALSKIGGYSRGATIDSEHAAQFSHLYFEQGIKANLMGLWSTHPPLDHRIKRILPNWKGDFLSPDIERFNAERKSKPGYEKPSTANAFTAGVIASQSLVNEAIKHIGEPNDSHLKIAQTLIAEIPEVLYQATHEPHSARAVIYALFIDQAALETREKQLVSLKTRCHKDTFSLIDKYLHYLDQLKRSQFIAVIELCMPALKSMSKVHKRNLLSTISELIKSDKKVNVFEWSYYTIIKHTLHPKRYHESIALTKALPSINIVFNFVLNATDYQNNNEKAQVLSRCASELKALMGREIKTFYVELESNVLSLEKVNKALVLLCSLKTMDKPKFLKAVGLLIMADNKVTQYEVEIFRAIADMINCPMPPIVLTHDV